MATTAVAHRTIRAGTRPADGRPAARRRTVVVRRRLVALVTIAGLVLALGVTWAMRSEAAPDGVAEATVVVAPGETVWDIATQYVPDGVHPQAYVAHVLRYNDVEASAVLPGTALRLPRP